MTSLPGYVLRFWETEFSNLRPQKSRGNHRLYTRAEIDLILKIKTLLYEERLTISGARQRFLQDRQDRDAHRDEPVALQGCQSSVFLLGWVKKEMSALLQVMDPSGRSAAR